MLPRKSLVPFLFSMKSEKFPSSRLTWVKGRPWASMEVSQCRITLPSGEVERFCPSACRYHPLSYAHCPEWVWQGLALAETKMSPESCALPRHWHNQPSDLLVKVGRVWKPGVSACWGGSRTVEKQLGSVEARCNLKGSRGRIGYDKQPLANFFIKERRRGLFNFVSQTIFQVREERDFKGR